MRHVTAVISLLRRVIVPSLRQHRGRAVLTLLGVVIGTQIVIAINLINRSILTSFEHTLEKLAGGADLQITNAAAGVPEDAVARIADLEGVKVAEGLVLDMLQTQHGDLTVLGVDLFADQTIRETQVPRRHVHIARPVSFANATDSIAPSTSFAEKAGLTLDATFEATGPTGRVSLVVRGLVDPVGPAALFGGAVALADLPTAQIIFGRGSRVDQINVQLDPGADAERVKAGIASIVGEAATVERPKERGANLGTMLASVQTMLTIASLNGVLVGFFIIYHTLSGALAQRRRQFALARAVGYRRSALVAAIVVEALAFGVLGAIIGTALGVLGASLSLDTLTSSVAILYARIDSPGIDWSMSDIWLALALGSFSALGGALAPAREAARLQVVDQLRARSTAAESSWRGSWALAFGLLVTAVGYAVCFIEVRPSSIGARVAWIMVGYVLIAVGYAALIPFGVRSFARLLQPAAERMKMTLSSVALRTLIQSPDRTRGTIAALMVAFALVLQVGTYVRGFRGSVLTWLDQVFAADLFVTAGPELPSPSGPTMPGTIEQALRTVPGIELVSGTRMLNINVAGHMAILKTDSRGAFERLQYPVLDHDGSDYMADFAAGRGLLLSDNLAVRTALKAGDQLSLETPSGVRQFKVSAIVVDYTRDSGTVIVEREVYRQVWQDKRANLLLVWINAGSDPESVRQAIRSHVGGPSFAVLTAGEYKGKVREVLNEALLLPYAIQLVAIFVAIIGVVNFFVAASVDRAREVGLLRSVALSQRQLVKLLSIEAGLIGTLGGAAAIAYGWPLSFLVVTRWQRLVSGWTLMFDFPALLALGSVLIATLVAIAAAYYPVRQTADRPLVELVGVE